jgi:hypothetical protein
MDSSQVRKQIKSKPLDWVQWRVTDPVWNKIMERIEADSVHQAFDRAIPAVPIRFNVEVWDQAAEEYDGQRPGLRSDF